MYERGERKEPVLLRERLIREGFTWGFCKKAAEKRGKGFFS